MANFFALVLCVSMAAIVAAEAASTSVVVMDQCTCTCPRESGEASKVETNSRTRRDVAGRMAAVNRKKRAVPLNLAFSPTVSYTNHNVEDKSFSSIKGDQSYYSNNGGNTNIHLGEGTMSGDDNKVLYKSQGSIGTEFGDMRTAGRIILG